LLSLAVNFQRTVRSELFIFEEKSLFQISKNANALKIIGHMMIMICMNALILER